MTLEKLLIQIQIMFPINQLVIYKLDIQKVPRMYLRKWQSKYYNLDTMLAFQQCCNKVILKT